MYGKLVDGKLEKAPKEFIEGGNRIIGFTEDFLQARGYKPIQIIDKTTESAISIIRTYTEDDDYIYCTISDLDE